MEFGDQIDVSPRQQHEVGDGIEESIRDHDRSARDALYLEVGDRSDGDTCDYPDIDMLVRWIDGVEKYVHKDGTPYPGQE